MTNGVPEGSLYCLRFSKVRLHGLIFPLGFNDDSTDFVHGLFGRPPPENKVQCIF